MWQTLWSASGNPVLLINEGKYEENKDEDRRQERIILALFDTEYSNIVRRNDFAFMFHNIFQTFMPQTVIDGNTFDVGQSITVNAQGNKLTMVYESESSEIFNLPSSIKLVKPGVYRFEPESLFLGKDWGFDEIYVKVPAAESNIFANGIALKAVYRDKESDDQSYQDLMIYFAAAMLALLFTEWFLQSHESI